MRLRALDAVRLAAALVAVPLAAGAQVRAIDDGGQAIMLPAPARRIASLSPHATELLFAAGAGDRIVATVAHADHPAAARAIPRVGDANRLDLERLIALRPDLAVAWLDGTPERHLDQLRRAGIPVYRDRPRKLDDVAASIERLGHLAGTGASAAQAAGAYRARLGALRRAQAGRTEVTVFFQVWRNPLLTLNGDQVIDDALRLCGGRNVFAGEARLVPTVDTESVVRRDPDVIVVTASPGDADEALAPWRRLPALRATASGNLLALDSAALARPSPGMLDGVERLCGRLDEARARGLR